MQNEAGGKNGWDKADWIARLTEEIEPWPEPVDGKALVDELAATVQRVVVMSKWAVEAVCLWVLHSYAFELRDITTYLGIESPQHRCGKSTLLDLLGVLVNRPVRAANISPPAFFRTIEEERPTLLVDEADTFLYSQELRGILNAGYQRSGAFVIRVISEVSNSGTENGEANGKGNGGNGSRRVKFSCWCPKAIARIGCLQRVLADRCIVIVMQRKLPTEKCGRLREIDAETLRRKCVRFVVEHTEAIRAAQPVIPEGMNDRAADIWEPLLAVADLAGGDWPERARKAAAGLTISAQESDPMGTLLMDILEMFLRSGSDRLFSKSITGWLNMSDVRPWMALRKGKTVTQQWLAQQLHAYGIRPKTLRIEEERAKGYEWSDFTEAFRRYVPRGELEEFKKEINEQRALREKEGTDGAQAGDEGRNGEPSGPGPSQIGNREEQGSEGTKEGNQQEDRVGG